MLVPAVRDCLLRLVVARARGAAAVVVVVVVVVVVEEEVEEVEDEGEEEAVKVALESFFCSRALDFFCSHISLVFLHKNE